MLYRAEGLLSLETIADRVLAILGIGSVGSQVAELLAYPFGSIQLVDPQLLAIENVERHALGRSYLGQNKALAMADFLSRERGLPRRMFGCWHGAREFLESDLAKVNLVIDCLADPRFSRESMEVCAVERVPLLMASVFPAGRGGQVLVLPEPWKLCRQCVEELLPQEVAPPHYGLGLNPEADNSIPALRVWVHSVAVWAADFALKLLCGEPVEAQSCIIGHRMSPVVSYPPGKQAEVLAAFVSGQEERGEVMTQHLIEQSGRFTRLVDPGIVCLRLPERGACVRHETVFMLDEI